jgi:hypothetical protein
VRRNTTRIMAAGQPVSWLGANFWSRAGGPFMWRSYDPAVIGAELRVLREHGLTMTRSFFFWPDFMPEPEVIDEETTGAEVIATDARGRPALLLRRVGGGSLVLGTYPVEHMAALTPRVNPRRHRHPVPGAVRPRRSPPAGGRRRPPGCLRHSGPRRRHRLRRAGQPRRRPAKRPARPGVKTGPGRCRYGPVRHKCPEIDGYRRYGPQPSRIARHYRRPVAALAGRVDRGIPQVTHTMA